MLTFRRRFGLTHSRARAKHPFKRDSEISGGLPTLVRIFREASFDDGVERRRQCRRQHGYRRWLTFENRGHEINLSLRFERFTTGDHLVQNSAKGKYVGPRIGFFAFELLRRHVLERAENRPFGSESTNPRWQSRGGRESGCGVDLLQTRQPEIQ